jgi:hypothetical protein
MGPHARDAMVSQIVIHRSLLNLLMSLLISGRGVVAPKRTTPQAREVDVLRIVRHSLSMPTPNWRHVLAMSMGIAKATDTADQIMQRVTGAAGGQPYLKSVFATALAVGAGVYLGDTGRERLLIASAIAGGAAVAHDQMEGTMPLVLRGRRGPRAGNL